MAIRTKRIALADDPIYKNGLIITSHPKSKESIKDSEQSKEKIDTEKTKQQAEDDKQEN